MTADRAILTLFRGAPDLPPLFAECSQLPPAVRLLPTLQRPEPAWLYGFWCMGGTGLEPVTFRA